MYKEPSLKSSYFGSGIGKTLYDYVLEHKPETIVEFGILHGYSTVCMAQALKDLGRGTIIAYDLWEEAPYGHGQTLDDVEQTLQEYGVVDFVDLRHGDFYSWLDEGREWEAELIHVDINNDGDLLPLLSEIACSVLFEGGIETRDRCWWMKKFSKPKMFPLKDALGYEILNSSYPSLSVFKK